MNQSFDAYDNEDIYRGNDIPEEGLEEEADMETQLFTACIGGNLDEVIRLLNAGNNIHETNSEWSLQKGAAPIHGAVIGGSIPILKLLVKRGANLNQATYQPDLETPLHVAVGISNFEMVQCLLEMGADYTCINQNQETPLQYGQYVHMFINEEQCSNLEAIINLLKDYENHVEDIKEPGCE